MIALLSHLGVITLILFAGLMLIYNASFLVVMSNAVSLVIDPHREIAGVDMPGRWLMLGVTVR